MLNNEIKKELGKLSRNLKSIVNRMIDDGSKIEFDGEDYYFANEQISPRTFNALKKRFENVGVTEEVWFQEVSNDDNEPEAEEEEIYLPHLDNDQEEAETTDEEEEAEKEEKQKRLTQPELIVLTAQKMGRAFTMEEIQQKVEEEHGVLIKAISTVLCDRTVNADRSKWIGNRYNHSGWNLFYRLKNGVYELWDSEVHGEFRRDGSYKKRPETGDYNVEEALQVLVSDKQ